MIPNIGRIVNPEMVKLSFLFYGVFQAECRQTQTSKSS